MDFRVLGPLEVEGANGVLALGGPKQRAVLANLLVRANEVVPADTLIAEIWGDEPPDKARNTLQTYISNLRKTLGETRLLGRPPGYLLAVDPTELDSDRFECLLRAAKQALAVDPSVAVDSVDDALDLWRGPALADLVDQGGLVAHAARLDELRISAQETRIEGLMASGSTARAVAELEPLVAANQLRESLWGLMMLALYRVGRQADALNAYQRAREILAAELGVDPSPELQKLHARVLEHDPALELRGFGLRGYRLLEKVTESQDGVVFRAIQPRVGRDVAIKVFDERIAADPVFTQRFDIDAQAAAALEHVSIVPIYDYWREPGRAFVVSRFLRGGSLERILDEAPLERSHAMQILTQVASALSFTHGQGLGHGNVGAASVLLDPEGNAYLGNPRIGVGEITRPDQDIRALVNLSHQMLAEMPAALREVVERADSGEEVPAEAFVFAATTSLEQPAPMVVEQVRNPFKGLRPFTEVDTKDFFGRRELTSCLLAAMTDDSPSVRFLALVGPSGCGKSSVLRAGLLPAIRAGAVSAGRPVYIAEMFPGAHPLEELEAALLRISVRHVSRLRDRLADNSRGLLEAVPLLVPETAEVVLVVDQLEELFTMTPHDRDRSAFLELLRVACADPDSRLRVLVTLRADFYDRPLLLPRFGELLASRTKAISPLTPDELEQAIRGPAQRAGLQAEPGLVAELIADVANEPGSLPLLQYALTELFERRDGNVLTLAAYREIGGVAQAVSSRAEDIFDSFAPTEQLATRQVFYRLVTLGEGREDTRRRVTRAELDALAVDPSTLDQILDTFGHHRILTFDREPLSREPTVEIAHEALLRGWERLRRWIDAAREDLRSERRLARAAADWRLADRDDSFLLRGARLDQVAAWVADTDLVIGQPELLFLKTSLDSRYDEIRLERERRDHERQIERRSTRMTRTLVVVFAVAALVAGTLTLVATSQGSRAAVEARAAHARELAAAAVANLEIDPERSILLAMSAVDQTRSVGEGITPEAESALHRAVIASRVLMTIPDVGNQVAWGKDVMATQSVTAPGTFEIRDEESGATLRTISARNGDLLDLEFSSTGELLVASGSGGKLEIWNPNTGARIAAIRGEGPAMGISVSGPLAAATWPDERTVRVLDVASGRVVSTIRHRVASTTALSPKGNEIALGSDSTVVLDLATGNTKYPPLERRYGAGDVAWSPDGRYLATSGIAGPDIWNAETGRHLYFVPDNPYVGVKLWSDDSTRLITGGDETGDVTVWEVVSSGPVELFRLTSQETSQGVDDISLSPDGNRVLASTGAGIAKVWDVSRAGDAEWANIETVTKWGDAAFLPDGESLVAADVDGHVRVWDISNGQATGPVIGPRVDEHALDVSRDGRWLTGIGSSNAAVWSVESGQRSFGSDVRAEADSSTFSPNAAMLSVNDGVTGHGTTLIDGMGQTVAVLPDQGGFTTWSSRFSPDGQLVATIGVQGDSNSLITLWDWQQEQIVRTITTPYAQGIAFDPESNRLATTWGSPTVWDVRSGDEALKLQGDLPAVGEVAFSPEGQRIAAAAKDGTIRLFDAHSGEQELSLDAGFASPVGRLAFSADGSKLVSQAPVTGVVRVWALDIDDLLDRAQLNLSRDFTDDECQQYLHIDQCLL